MIDLQTSCLLIPASATAKMDDLKVIRDLLIKAVTERAWREGRH